MRRSHVVVRGPSKCQSSLKSELNMFAVVDACLAMRFK